MKILKTFISLIIFTIMIFVSRSSVFAVTPKGIVSYEPTSANFSLGQKNVMTLVLQAQVPISAAQVIIESTGGVKIVEVLDVQNAKVIRQNSTDRHSDYTVLLVQNTADLPTVLKIPVVVTNTGKNAGNLKIDIKKSQVTDGDGKLFSLSQAKAAYITFAQTGKNTNPLPSPAPVRADTVSVNITARFQGIDPKSVKIKTIAPVKVQLTQGIGTAATFSLPQFVSFTFGDDTLWHGTALIPNIKPGKDYTLLIKGPKHLQKRICENAHTEQKEGLYSCTEGKIEIGPEKVLNLNISGIVLMAGDVGIQDAVLNAYDLSFVQNTIRKTAKNSAVDADVNYDGKVNKTDYEMLVYTLKNTLGLDQK